MVGKNAFKKGDLLINYREKNNFKLMPRSRSLIQFKNYFFMLVNKLKTCFKVKYYTSLKSIRNYEIKLIMGKLIYEQ